MLDSTWGQLDPDELPRSLPLDEYKGGIKRVALGRFQARHYNAGVTEDTGRGFIQIHRRQLLNGHVNVVGNETFFRQNIARGRRDQTIVIHD